MLEKYAVCLSLCAVALSNVIHPADKPRMLVLSDMGNEPDDAESFVRLMLYANEIDIEGMIATTSIWLQSSTNEKHIHEVLSGYSDSLPNLQQHATKANPYPSFEYLTSITTASLPLYGLAGVGSLDLANNATDLIIAAADVSDPHGRPLYIQLWGGASCLAQALWIVRATRTPAQLKKFLSKIRVYSISDQDDAGPWIRREFPTLPYIVSVHGVNQYALAAWGGISGDSYYGFKGGDASIVTMDWVRKNVQVNGSALGSWYPDFAYIMEGDSPAFLGLIPTGLNYPSEPSWGGWGGRYTKTMDSGANHFSDVVDWVNSTTDGQLHISNHATIWRWRSAYQNDFAGRIQWTLNKSKKANDPPEVYVAGGDKTWNPVFLNTTAGSTITLNATSSLDPDGDALTFSWMQYREVGLYQHNLELEMPSGYLDFHGTEATSALQVTFPPDVSFFGLLYLDKRDFHFILSVSDNGVPTLTRYRRVVVTVYNNV
ncbi:hypothetical protein C8R44DRAFT_987603 [Mycena epipterygia]|nr:hypothetical protein C8R44DRAFT_987603 [Mycena epipterygia]